MSQFGRRLLGPAERSVKAGRTHKTSQAAAISVWTAPVPLRSDPMRQSTRATARPNIRLAADIGGTFTDIAVFDDKSGNLTFGKALSTPAHLVEGISGRRKGRQRLWLGRAVPARLDHRHQHHPRAHRRAGPRWSSPRLSRHLRDRPHQPAGCLQPVLPEARAAGRARAALRGRRSASWPTARSTVRSTRPRSSSSGVELGGARRSSAVAILFLNCYRNPDHEARAKAHPGGGPSRHVRLGLARAVAGIPRVRALLDGGGQRLYRPQGPPLYRRDRRSHPRRGLSRLVPGGAVDRRSLRGRPGPQSSASACWNPGRPPASSARRRCAARSGLDNAIAFDMGGTTAKAGVIHKGEALTTGSALIGGYEQALPVQIAMMDIFEVGTGGGSIARVEDGGAARRAAERRRAAGAGLLRARRQRADRHRRQSRARAACAPTASSAARCGSIPRPRGARSRRTSPSRSASGRHGRRRRHSAHRRRPPCPMRSRA